MPFYDVFVEYEPRVFEDIQANSPEDAKAIVIAFYLKQFAKAETIEVEEVE